MPGLALVLAAPSSAATDCGLQELVDLGGLVAVPAGCVQEQDVVVSRDTTLGGGPFAARGRITVQSGARLALADSLVASGNVFVQEGAAFEAVGADIQWDGQLWVYYGASARLEGTGGAGVGLDRMINDGVTSLAGLVRVGRADEGLATGLGGLNWLRLGSLTPGSRLFFQQPRAAQAVAQLVGQDLAVPLAEAVFCDGGGCTPSLATGTDGSTWLVLTPTGLAPPSTPTPTPTEPTASPTPEPTPTASPPTASAIQEAVATARDGATLEVPAGTTLTETLVIADADGSAKEITLTGGPVARGHGGELIEVPPGSRLSLEDIAVDGSATAASDVAPDAAAVVVQPGGALVLGDGAQIRNNPSYGVVNQGEVRILSANAAITGCTLDADRLARSSPVGGAGLWNRAGGSVYMAAGAISYNTVKSSARGMAYGGGVLNAGTMWVYGGRIIGNSVAGDGGGFAVVREPGADQGGRLDLGTYTGQVTVSGVPELTGNSAVRGGAVVVADRSEWGGTNPKWPTSSQPPADVPAVTVDQAVIKGNAAEEAGAGLAAYGGAAVEFRGPALIGAGLSGSGPFGIAIADAYFRVTGDPVTEQGGGIGLLVQGWPIFLGDGFTGSGRLLVESVDGLEAGTSSQVVVWGSSLIQAPQSALDAVSFDIPGLSVVLELGPDGEIVTRAAAAGGQDPPEPSATPTPPGSPPSPSSSATPVPPSPTLSATPTRTPTPTQTPTPTSSRSATALPPNGTRPTSRTSSAPASTEPSDTTQTTARPTPSAGGTGTGLATPSAAGSGAAVGGSGEPSDAGGSDVVAIPEPPVGASMRTLGFALMAVGVFGLAVLGVYVMRRSGFFAT
jgi:outer membrane biosynthesis protein TonB